MTFGFLEYMLPVLLDLSFLKIYTFGVFLVLAFFWSTFLLWRNIRLTSFKEEDVFDGLFVSLGFGLFIGRLVYVLFNFNDFGFSILKFILVNGYPGLSLYGGMLGVFIGLYLFFAVKKIKFSEIADYYITPAFVALAIGKLGSFFSGVEIGAKTKFPIAFKYAGHEGFRHLTALYEGLLFLIGAYVSYKLLFEIRRQNHTKGFAVYFFWWFTALVYFLFDPLKSIHLTFLSQDSLNKTISLAILLTFSLYFLYYFRTVILDRVGRIKNLLFNYGQATISGIYQRTKKKAPRGENQGTTAD